MILIPFKVVGICAGVTNADYATTTEVYPDSPQSSHEECNCAQADCYPIPPIPFGSIPFGSITSVTIPPPLASCSSRTTHVLYLPCYPIQSNQSTSICFVLSSLI